MSAVRIFEAEYYRRLRDIERRHPWARSMRRLETRLLDRYLPAGSRLRILDAGCGAGIFLAELVALRPGAWAAGGDIAEPAVRLAMQTGVMRPLQFDARRLPLAAESFDVVISNDVLQHLGEADAQAVLAEAYRTLQPGGVLVLRTAARRGILWKKHRDTADYRQRNRPRIKTMLCRGGRVSRLEVNGMVVGAFSHAEYEGSSIDFLAGDLLCAFTDGISEPENPYGEDFSEERLSDLIAREADRPIQEIIRIVLEEVAHWSAGAAASVQDDQTVLLARGL